MTPNPVRSGSRGLQAEPQRWPAGRQLRDAADTTQRPDSLPRLHVRIASIPGGRAARIAHCGRFPHAELLQGRHLDECCCDRLVQLQARVAVQVQAVQGGQRRGRCARTERLQADQPQGLDREPPHGAQLTKEADVVRMDARAGAAQRQGVEAVPLAPEGFRAEDQLGAAVEPVRVEADVAALQRRQPGEHGLHGDAAPRLRIKLRTGQHRPTRDMPR